MKLAEVYLSVAVALALGALAFGVRQLRTPPPPPPQPVYVSVQLPEKTQVSPPAQESLFESGSLGIPQDGP